jgi:hypothetical protein
MKNIKFAGIEFTGREYENGDVKLTENVFRKILKQDIDLKVRYADEIGKINKTFTPNDIEEYLVEEYKPYAVLYYSATENTVRFSPCRNFSVTVLEKADDPSFGHFFMETTKGVDLTVDIANMIYNGFNSQRSRASIINELKHTH